MFDYRIARLAYSIFWRFFVLMIVLSIPNNMILSRMNESLLTEGSGLTAIVFMGLVLTVFFGAMYLTLVWLTKRQGFAFTLATAAKE